MRQERKAPTWQMAELWGPATCITRREKGAEERQAGERGEEQGECVDEEVEGFPGEHTGHDVRRRGKLQENERAVFRSGM